MNGLLISQSLFSTTFLLPRPSADATACLFRWAIITQPSCSCGKKGCNKGRRRGDEYMNADRGGVLSHLTLLQVNPPMNLSFSPSDFAHQLGLRSTPFRRPSITLINYLFSGNRRMSPAQSIPSSSSHLPPSTIDTTLLSILASKGLQPSSVA